MRNCGVTAMNVTVNLPSNGRDRFEKSIEIITATERELTAHPEVFIKVFGSAQLLQAKLTHRAGINMGCQDTTMLEGDLARLQVSFTTLAYASAGRPTTAAIGWAMAAWKQQMGA